MRASLIVAPLVLLTLFATPAIGQDVTTETVEGVRNFRRVGTTIACAGAITPQAVPEIASMGFASIINMRMDDEPGNDVVAARAAADAAGIRYVHIPWNGQPNEDVARQFLEAITSDGTEPAFVHCAGGGRAATMWMIKRIAVDGWEVERASEEAIALGAGNPESRRFAAEYALANRR
jgi:uncharacterized protein (TIGR01244 family)